MLRTNTQLLLSEALLAPPGYAPEFLLGTTYSLHLGALLAVPLGLTFADWEAEDGDPAPDPVAALEAVRRYAGQMVVFCQAGATAATEQVPLVASWLEDVVVPTQAPMGGVFHPKIWIVRYVHPHEPPAYRVVCGSRNLTFDRSWDTALVLDGSPTVRGGVAPSSTPIADFVEALPELATASITADRQDAINSLAAELRRVRFAAPEGFTDATFWPLGLEGYQHDPISAVSVSRMLVVSPFIGATRLSKLPGSMQDGILVSRADTLEAVGTTALPASARLYAFDEPEVLDEGVRERLSGLHAKVYVADDGRRAHVWTGSANATTAAFEENVEFLVRLDGTRGTCGIDAMLGEDGDKYAFSNMLMEVPAGQEAADPDLKTELERELDDVAHDLAERRITAMVSSQEGGPELRVDLLADPPLELPLQVGVACWPLTGDSDRDRVEVPRGEPSLACFERQSLDEVTAFYVFSLRLTRHDVTVEKRIVVRADLVGEIAGRREAILRELLKDPQQVLRLLQALLAFDSEGLALRPPASGGAEGKIDSRRLLETPLLEALLRALADDPAKLDAVAGFLDELSETADLVPKRLLEIWTPIHDVHLARLK